MTTTFLSLQNLKNMLGIGEKLIQKQNRIVATLNRAIRTDEKTFKEGTRVKLLYQVTEGRYGITTDLHGDVTEAIVFDNELKDVHLEN